MENLLSPKGIRFSHVLTVIFVLARIGNYISWEWWVVFMPTIVDVGFLLLVMIFNSIIKGLQDRHYIRR